MPDIDLVAWARSRFQHTNQVRVVPYHGFGRPESAKLLVRILRDPAIPAPEADDSAWENLLANIERLESDELVGVPVQATLYHTTVTGISDADGYLELHFKPSEALTPGWHEVVITAEHPAAASAVGKILIPPADGFGVISDIDDTVVEADVRSPLKLVRNFLLENAETREPFPGVSALYQALAAGPTGNANNPIFYVSGSPWNLYDLLVDLFARRGIPTGPILMRSLERETLLPALQGHSTLRLHKLTQITYILSACPNLPFILFGDSGQRDPETYLEILKAFPGRVKAVYIRDVVGERRDAEVAALAEGIAALGATLCYSADTATMVAHAKEQGWIR